MTVQRDRRQEILDRLDALFSGVTINLAGGPNGPIAIVPAHYVRNRNELQKDKVPGIILLDADEVQDPRVLTPPRGGTETRMPVQLMRMTPEVYVVLDERGVQNKNVGKDLNTARLALLNLVFTDGQLQTIVGANGKISYDGAVTDLARNRTMKGQLGMSFTFTYPLILAEYAS